METLLIGWTTLDSLQSAKKLAQLIIAEKLAACAQIDSPITSIYSWEGAIKEETEYRLSLKFPSTKSSQLENFITENHPYDTPQWITIQAENASKSYKKWVFDSCM